MPPVQPHATCPVCYRQDVLTFQRSKATGRQLTLHDDPAGKQCGGSKLTVPVFVFGSNLNGHHHGGAARHAYDNEGAFWGQGVGPQGNSYGIPSLDWHFKKMPLAHIAMHVEEFVAYAKMNPKLRFYVAAIGCKIAGFTPDQIGPLFAAVPSNVTLCPEFQPYRATKAGRHAATHI